MPSPSKRQPELLDGADADKDCAREAPDLQVAVVIEEVEHDEDEDEQHQVSWRSLSAWTSPTGDDLASWRPTRGRWSQTLERFALAVEKPINRLTTTQLNPLYHTGTIAFFLLLIVGGTGLYLFFFFQYGYDASYQAVARMESQFIARLIRAAHRYASGALVIATLLHAYRTFFLEKFRGPRWLAWLTGVLMTALLWFAGVTGYALIWDIRAQALADAFGQLLNPFGAWSERYTAWMVLAGERGASWAFFLAVLVVHVTLFLIVVGSFVLHIRRLRRPRWLPPVQWVSGIAIVLLLVSALFPVGMLPQADASLLPGPLTFDPIFLSFLPFRGAWGFWAAAGALLLAAAALPWLGRQRLNSTSVDSSRHGSPSAGAQPDKVRIIKDRCTGCTKCALDCPYGAITMVERHDGHPHKYIAIEDPSRCVSCGICVGSCDGVAVTLGSVAPESLWGLVSARMAAVPPDMSLDSIEVLPPAAPGAIESQAIPGRQVVFTCERHTLHGARPYIDGSRDTDWMIIPVPCVGTVAPDLLVRTLDAGATAVKVVGCPPDDCANREGNLWTEQRLTRQRVPRLRKPYEMAPITADWLPPDAFAAALDQPLAAEVDQVDYAAARRMARPLRPHHYLAAFAILAAVLLVQVLLSDLPFTPYPNPPAVARIVVERPGEPFGQAAFPGMLADRTYDVVLEVDGQVVERRTLSDEALMGETAKPLVLEAALSPGDHTVVVRYVGGETGAAVTLVNETVAIQAGQVFRPALPVPVAGQCDPSATGACGF